ncbi:MAG TPA: DUF2092 domain-containing protein [Dongiaceae bacterium]|nr:DUF2092 domain-containing protein [Dongiaceae bacterium]
MRNRNPFPDPAGARLGLALAACALSGCMALSVAAADDKPAVDPRADELVKRMGDYLGQAPFFSVNAEVWQDVDLSSGQRVQAGRTLELQVRRPDRLRAEVHSTRRNRELVYDGNAITLFNRAQNFYGTVSASGPLDEAMDLASERFGIPMPLEDFIRSDPHKDLLQKAASGIDIGPVSVLGVACEHLAFTQENIDWQIWIEDGARPVPRKFVITYKDEPDSPQYTAIFSNWDFATKLPDFLFKFEPPAGAVKIKVKEIRAANQAPNKEEK